MAQEELQESKLTKAGGRKPTHGCNYPMVGWPSVILTPMGPSLNLTREGTSRPSLRSSLSLSAAGIHLPLVMVYLAKERVFGGVSHLYFAVATKASFQSLCDIIILGLVGRDGQLNAQQWIRQQLCWGVQLHTVVQACEVLAD